MIRIICGTCGTSKGYKTAADGELTLPAAEEKRLVARGVAEYVTRPVIGTDDTATALAMSGKEVSSFATRAGAAFRTVMDRMYDADSPVDGGDGGGTGINPPDEDPPVEELENGGGEDPAGGLPDSAETLDIVDGHFTRESLMLMRRPDMEKLAGDLGVDVSRCKNKGDIADLLVEVEVEAPAEDGGEAPPELGAEAPVV